MTKQQYFAHIGRMLIITLIWFFTRNFQLTKFMLYNWRQKQGMLNTFNLAWTIKDSITCNMGILVMLTKNIDLKVGAINGTIGIITKLEFDLENNVCSIFLALNPLGYVQIVWKILIQNKYDSQGHFYKTSFPLMLGYAIIGHKSQGAMISSKVMIHIHESFAQGLEYVMVFRVTSWKKLKIVNNLQPSDIQPMLPWFLENMNIVENWNINTCIIVI